MSTPEMFAEYRPGGSLAARNFDYRKLLSVYMAHVIAHASISFLEYSVPFETEFDALSEAELAELERIEKHVRAL